MADDRGLIYDIFFDSSVPYTPLKVLTGRSPAGSIRGLILLELYPNIGDIGENFWEERYKLLSWYETLFGISSTDTMTHFYEQKDRCDTLSSAREGTDVLRIWHTSSCRDICSLAFLMDLFKGKDLTVIEMQPEGMLRFSDLSNAPDEVIFRSFAHSGLIGEEKRHFYEKLWEDLSTENAPVRTVDENGNVIGTTDDHFDEEILLKIPPEGALFSEAVKDLVEDRRLDDMGKLFWTRRIRRLISKDIITVTDEDTDRSIYPFECRIAKK